MSLRPCFRCMFVERRQVTLTELLVCKVDISPFHSVPQFFLSAVEFEPFFLWAEDCPVCSSNLEEVLVCRGVAGVHVNLRALHCDCSIPGQRMLEKQRALFALRCHMKHIHFYMCNEWNAALDIMLHWTLLLTPNNSFICANDMLLWWSTTVYYLIPVLWFGITNDICLTRLGCLLFLARAVLKFSGFLCVKEKSKFSQRCCECLKSSF